MSNSQTPGEDSLSSMEQARLIHLNQLLLALRAVSRILHSETNAQTLCQKVCESLGRTRGYVTVWLGRPDFKRNRVEPLAIAGAELNAFLNSPITLDDRPTAHGPVGTAIREQRIVIFDDLANDPRFAPWRAGVLPSGAKSMAAVPLLWGKEVLGVLAVKADKVAAFDAEEVELLNDLAKDLAHALHGLDAAAAHADTQEHLQTLVAAMPDAVFFKDGDGRWLIVNELAKTLFRLDQRPWLGRTDAELAGDLPELKAAHESCIISDEQAWQAGRLTIGEEEISLPDGRRVVAEVYKLPLFHADGRRKGLIAIGRDITERKKQTAELARARDFYLSLLENAPALVWRAGPDAKCDWFNAGWMKFTGRRLDQEVGEGWTEGVHPDDLQRCMAHYLASFQERKSFEMEYRLRRHDGQYRWIVDHGVPFKRLDGSFGGYVGYCYDITERIHADVEREVALTKYQTLFECLPLGITITDEVGRIVESNGAARTILGVENLGIEQQSQDSPAWKMIWPNGTLMDRADYPSIRALREKRTIRNVEMGMVKSPGETRWLTVTAAPISLPGLGAVIAYSDVTEHKQMELGLRSSEYRFRLFMDSNPAIAWMKDEEGRFVYANATFERVFGRQLSELVGRRDGELWPADQAELYRTNDRAVLDASRPMEFVEPSGSAAGKSKIWLSVKFPFQDGAGNRFVAGMATDITEREKILADNQRLATIVEQAAEAIFITDLAGQIEYVNPAFEKISGYRRIEVLGKTPRILKAGRQNPQFYRDLWRVLEQGKTWRGRFVNRRKDGTIYEEDAVISPIRDATGKITGYVAVNHDLTREVQLEAQFRQAQKMEAIGTLAGGIAHDFNNILMAIFAYGGMLRNELGETGELREMTNEILKAANRAKELVQQILTFSRQREQKREIISLAPVIKEAVKFLRSSLPASLKVEMELANDAPTVLADATQIHQIIMNLATNGVHAMEGKPGFLRVSLDAWLPNQADLQSNPKLQAVGYARLRVADAGCGMDARTLERIFEPFFTTKGVGKGTGLGLAVVHGIVQSHEGVIAVDSAPNQGTIFSIYLPAQNQPPRALESAASEPPRGSGQRILVVDDELALGAAMGRLLRQLGYQPVVCNCPQDALAMLDGLEPVAAVITDLSMPLMSGLELAARIHGAQPDLPILLISGFASALTHQELEVAGIRELIHKPFSISEVAHLLHAHLSTERNGPAGNS